MDLSEFSFDMDEADKPPVHESVDIKNCIRFGNITPLTSLLHTDRNALNADINGWGKPHMYATKAGRLSIVKLFVENGADVNASVESGQTALYFAIWYDHFDVFEYLLSKGANVNQRDNFGSTPLMQAAYYGRKQMFEVLINKGAEISAENTRGFTAIAHLRDVCRLGRYWDQNFECNADIIKLTVLDLLGRDNKSLNARDCNKLGIIDVPDLIHHYDITQLSLLVGIPDIDVVNLDIPIYGKPLIYATMHGNISIVKLLVQNGADVNASDEGGNSALCYAAWHDHYDVAFYLVSRGANVNQCDNENSTPLIEAAKYKRKEMVELFIKRNADICAKNKRGMNAIDFAKFENYREIVTLLEKELRNSGLENTGKYGNTSVDEVRATEKITPHCLTGKSEETHEDDGVDYEYTGFSGTDGCPFDQGIPGQTKADKDAFLDEWYEFCDSSSEDDEKYGIHRGPKDKRVRR